jgi:multimeric flavodoxin WrbA
MKVTAFVGSGRKKHTYKATERFLKKLQTLGDVEYEIVMLSDYNLQACKGCCLCMDMGEELCPLKDDRDKLIRKIHDSDGIVFASPNYSFQVSSLMKIFIDRLAFCLHRPRFFGKTYTSIVVQGTYGGADIVKYLDFVGKGLGFNTVKGCCISTLEPITEKTQRKNDETIDRLAERFYSRSKKNQYPTPSLLWLAVFRIGRTSRRIMLDESCRDYTYLKEKGWFESDYYYPVKLNPFKKAAGKVADMIAVRMAKSN